MLVILNFFVFYIIILNMHSIFVLLLHIALIVLLDGTDYDVCLNI